ncbi:MAG: hypothetical protein PHX54_01945 [Lentimicrobiaceae bacterium]|nr:hypothetical protein [Lentimicrobiaceae bacterium]
MQTNKDKWKGIAGTLIFHGLLLIAIMFLALRTPLPLPEEAGVEVNLGYSDQGMGDIQPPVPAATESAAAPQPETSTAEELVSEQTEEAPRIEPVIKPRPKIVETTPEKPAPKPVPVEKPQPVVNPNAMYKGKTSGSEGGNQGITGQPGDQGKPNGDPNSNNYDGQGGSGGGVSYSLEGRGIKSLPQPNRTFSESGTVVITIYVNRGGTVNRINEAPARGTTTGSSQLIQLAKQAAKQAKFSANPDAPEEQVGTITYIFKLTSN